MEKEEKIQTKKSRLGFMGKPWRWFKSRRKRTKLLIIVVLIIGFFVVMGRIQAANKKPDFTTARATQGNITETVSETGVVSSAGFTEIYSPTNGIVEEVYYKNGNPVAVGDQLFKIKSSATEQEKSAARANLLTAQNTLNAANAQLNALQADLFTANQTFVNGRGTSDPDTDDPTYIIQRANWLAAEAAYKNQQTVISQAQAAVSNASLLYQATQDAIVKATANGEISNISVAVGSSVKANTSSGVATTARPIAAITNQANSEVVIGLSENDVYKVEDGQSADIEIKAIKKKTYDGQVVRVDTVGTDETGVTKYNAYIQIQNPDEKIRAGMKADAEIVTEKLTGVLTVPNSAVKPYKGGRAVRVIDKKSKEGFKYVPVEIGLRGKDKTEILSGIKEGQEVITAVSNEKAKKGLF